MINPVSGLDYTQRPVGRHVIEAQPNKGKVRLAAWWGHARQPSSARRRFEGRRGRRGRRGRWGRRGRCWGCLLLSVACVVCLYRRRQRRCTAPCLLPRLVACPRRARQARASWLGPLLPSPLCLAVPHHTALSAHLDPAQNTSTPHHTTPAPTRHDTCLCLLPLASCLMPHAPSHLTPHE
ncbi:hypothetical protein BS50DRAFT_140824 [Corynespora cassiicola Philippines]|uniref:Uncharacterized protein n=1 Tax=Corynespora cassiicola Philippines TaxID=1448308 RepID=A0A2T2N9Z8_CORCC|nr:hypothetical protein BS50DRAFT_140824 [Corynespora cassiicola Philippines]